MFCTACGRPSPDDARFCAQCGTRIASTEPAGGPGDQGAASGVIQPGGGEATATIQFGQVTPAGGPADKAESSDRALNPVDAAAVDALPIGHALLVVQKGPGAGNRFLMDADVVHAGRHPKSEIFLDDVTVSRSHATFTRNGGDFSVSDAGSLNGTYVNRDRIEEVVLQDGDEVQIGKYRLVFFAGHEGH